MQPMPYRRRAAPPLRRNRGNLPPLPVNRRAELPPPMAGTLVNTVLLPLAAAAVPQQQQQRHLTRPISGYPLNSYITAATVGRLATSQRLMKPTGRSAIGPVAPIAEPYVPPRAPQYERYAGAQPGMPRRPPYGPGAQMARQPQGRYRRPAGRRY